MKYKHVFLIWLLADAFLAGGLCCFMLYEQFTGGAKDDFGMFFLLALLGVGFSTPSLVAMMLFHLVFTKKAKDTADYKVPYILLIIVINILYLIIGQVVFGMTSEFNFFYLGSTVAGLLAFYIVDRKIKKAATVVINE